MSVPLPANYFSEKDRRIAELEQQLAEAKESTRTDLFARLIAAAEARHGDILDIAETGHPLRPPRRLRYLADWLREQQERGRD